MKTEREFDPGQAPVYPLPSREPWETFAQWGMPPERPGAYERPWDSPGPPPPPWVASRPSGPPTWAVAAVLVGSALVLIAVAVLAVLNG